MLNTAVKGLLSTQELTSRAVGRARQQAETLSRPLRAAWTRLQMPRIVLGAAGAMGDRYIAGGLALDRGRVAVHFERHPDTAAALEPGQPDIGSLGFPQQRGELAPATSA